MTDSLLNQVHKNKIKSYIDSGNYKPVIDILDSLKTAHAGTAKMKDKKYVTGEIIRYVSQNSNSPEKDLFKAGKKILSVRSDNAKEIGIHIISKGYKFNREAVTSCLYKIADDKNWEVREYAAGAITNVLKNNPGFYKTLKRWSKDRSVNVRRAVVMSASALRDRLNYKKAFVLLEPLMYDDSIYIKKNLGPFILGSYFGNALPEETFRQLDRWIKIQDEQVRWNIAMAFNCSFGNKYPEKALKYLKILSNDNSRIVSRAVKSALRSLGKKHPLLVEKFAARNEIAI